ncbi:5'-nucleotidase C-terminal domain-containing protein [Ilumatobacter sp.]|uniref:5'-nucleotidase C-terminal domain-containing protein n=1 Tax=Ilumatobacter sp. TaxID=1967498 RepID=UPI003B52D96B
MTPASAAPGDVELQLLAFNDYHGHVEAGTPGDVGDDDAGGSEYLSAKLTELRDGATNSLTVAAGDLIGGSPFFSGLFHDEPAIETLNEMGLDIAGVGNHEFDEGVDELLRIQDGGCHPVDGCYFPDYDPDTDGDQEFGGADFPYLAANVVESGTSDTVLPAYEIREVEGEQVAFIGMTLEGTPELVAAAGIEGYDFLDEVDTANALVPQIQADNPGVEAFVLLLHEGGFTDPFVIDGCPDASGPVITIAQNLTSEIDAIVSGHTHQPYTCSIPDPDGDPRLVTSAFSYGRVVTEINLEIGDDGEVDRSTATAVNHPVVQAADLAQIDSVEPARLLDTREGNDTVDGESAGGGQLAAGDEIELQIAGRDGIPDDAAAVALNIGAVQPDDRGFLTVYPCTDDRPQTSNLNYVAGENRANLTTVDLDDDGAVCIYTSADTDVIADYGAVVPAEGSPLAVDPVRVLETRIGDENVTVDGESQGGGTVEADSVTAVRVAGRAGIPSVARAVTVNVGAVSPAAKGFLTIFPCGSERPLASNVNFEAGGVVSNSATVQVGEDGEVCIYTDAATDLIADVTAYVPFDGTPTPFVPERLVDTREGNDTIDGENAGEGRLGAGETLTIDVAGRGSVPDDVDTLFLSAASIQAEGRGFLTFYPCAAGRPLASNINYEGDDTVSNGVIVDVDDAGQVCVYTQVATDLIVDATAATSVADAPTPPTLAEEAVRPDAAITAIIEKWRPLVEERSSDEVGTITADIARGGEAGSDRGVESSAANLVADAQLFATQVLDADLALMNPGGVRSDLEFEGSDAGEGDGVVTYGEAFTFQPFNNTLVVLEMTGAQIVSVLEEQCQPAGGRPFLALGVSEGFTFDQATTFDPDTGECTGITITNVQLDGTPLVPGDTYRVTANNFLADGGDNFDTFEEIGEDGRTLGPQDIEALISYFEAESPVAPPPTDRINELS